MAPDEAVGLSDVGVSRADYSWSGSGRRIG